MNEYYIRISDLQLSARTTRILQENGMLYLEELSNFTCYDLLVLKGMGKKSLNEIIQILCLNKLSLRDEIVDSDVKNIILKELPEKLREIKKQVDDMQNDLRFFAYKIEQIAQCSEKTKRKIDVLNEQ